MTPVKQAHYFPGIRKNFTHLFPARFDFLAPQLLATTYFYPLLPPTEKVISVEQPPLLIAENRNATIFCKFTCNSAQMKKLKVSMFKGTARNVEVCTADWNTSATSFDVKRSKFSCHVMVNTTVVMFHLHNLNVSDTDIYFCKIEAVYPPPYHHSEGNGTVIHVKEGNPPLA